MSNLKLSRFESKFRKHEFCTRIFEFSRNLKMSAGYSSTGIALDFLELSKRYDKKLFGVSFYRMI